MRNERDHVCAGAAAGHGPEGGACFDCSERPQVRGVAGGLRPYRDVRAGFEPWRRLALMVWPSPDDKMTAH